MELHNCPSCKEKSATYDKWEDCFLCQNCGFVFYPKVRNPEAGIWKVGGANGQ